MAEVLRARSVTPDDIAEAGKSQVSLLASQSILFFHLSFGRV